LFMVGAQADLLERSPIRAQLVGRHLGRSEAVLPEQLADELACRGLVPPALDQDFQHLALIANPAMRLIAFHHAAGSAGSYYPLNATLPSDWDLLLLDLPGRGKRHAETPIAEMPDLVARVMEDVRPWLDAPFALFGHSLGAIIAAEVGRACENLGSPPVWVGISGRIAPTLGREGRSLHKLDDESLMHELLTLGGTPSRISEMPEFLQLFLRNARADLAAVDSYAPEPERAKSSYPMTAFSGTSDPWAPPDTMLPWERETEGSFRLRQFVGGHFYFLGSEFAKLANAIVADVEQYGIVK
jgi:medium-chain acyl-[acyl-carrier-protein] hydrolase